MGFVDTVKDRPVGKAPCSQFPIAPVKIRIVLNPFALSADCTSNRTSPPRITFGGVLNF
jgi:hypothetical protein